MEAIPLSSIATLYRNLLFILMPLLFTGISDGKFLERRSLGGVYQFRAVLIYAGPFRCRELNVSTIRLYTAPLFIGISIANVVSQI